MATTQNLGIVCPTPQGDWQSGKTYPKLSIVRNETGSYQAKSTNTNIQPGVSPGWQNYWMLLNTDGGIGPQGPQGNVGEGVPTGGLSGNVLVKNSNTNYDAKWIPQNSIKAGSAITDASGNNIPNTYETKSDAIAKQNQLIDTQNSLQAQITTNEARITSLEQLTPGLTLEKTKIYGVDGVGKSNPTLTRTDAAEGLIYTRTTTGEIYSDFNTCYPWSDICEVTDKNGNVFVKIPKFYTRVTKNANGTYKYQISGVRYDGFSTLFIDGKGNEIDYVLVGKYEGSGSGNRIYSKSGQNVLVWIGIDSFRNACKANGEGYQQYDFLIDAIIKQLFMIEFATTNSQSIMLGWTASRNTAALSTGRTDSVKTASGEPAISGILNAGYYACKYRGIENPWGNIWTWCDGIAFSAEKIFVCTDPTAYVSTKVDAPYFYMGDRCMTGGYASVITPFDKMHLLGYTTVVDGTYATYYSDYCYVNNSGNVLAVGGNWNSGYHAGLWGFNGDISASQKYSFIGGRLCYKPI